MNSRKLIILTAIFILAISGAAYSQSDAFGSADTIYAETYRIDDNNWGVNVSMFNDEEIMALSIPFIFTSGKTKVIADSTVFIGGIAEAFRIKQSRVDTMRQCLTIGPISDIGVSVPPIQPGKGRIATIFVSAFEGAYFSSLLRQASQTALQAGTGLGFFR